MDEIRLPSHQPFDLDFPHEPDEPAAPSDDPRVVTTHILRQNQVLDDAELLKLPLPTEQLFKIWQRNFDNLSFIRDREIDVVRRARMSAGLLERRAAMNAILNRRRVR
jgi:hypothetical protein